MINILYLVRTYALGGAQTIVCSLLRNLSQQDFKITVAVYDAPGSGDQDFIDQLANQGIATAPERIPWHGPGRWFAAGRHIDALIERYQIDIVHTHDNISNLLVGIGRGRFRCRTIASAYGWWQPKWNIKINAYYWIEKNIALPNFDCVYTVSEDMKRRVLAGRTSSDKVHVIYTGIDAATLSTNGQQRRLARQRFGIPEHAVVIGTVSRLYPEKGHRYLLDATARLLADTPNLRVLIIGQGHLRDSLQHQARQLNIERHVLFPGYVDDLPAALQAMDIFAQPSVLEEGFPTSVLEAQAAGLPVVASDIGGTRETLRPDVTGILVPPASTEQLYTALRELLRDPRKTQAMADAARYHVAERFSLQGMINRIAGLYFDLSQPEPRT